MRGLISFKDPRKLKNYPLQMGPNRVDQSQKMKMEVLQFNNKTLGWDLIKRVNIERDTSALTFQ